MRIEAVEDGASPRALPEFRAYVEGGAELPWALDLRLARSPFQRKVLARTASIPYGAVVSYKRLASDLGQPRAVRAVAQALRWNPIPVAIPCHRVVGASGLLTGYAGGETGRKRQLLTTEGVPLVPAHNDFAVARGAIPSRAWRQRVLPPELPVDGDATVRAPDVLRLPEPGRGGRAQPLHELPPGPPPPPRGQLSESDPAGPADEALFPGFRRERIRTREAEIHTVVGGHGPPVLLLHGYPETHACWHRVAPALAARFTGVCPDLRGYGDNNGLLRPARALIPKRPWRRTSAR
jgi:O-6-methylguanine DNA methyltransferase